MIKIYADGADLNSILELNKNPLIEGFTTNPTLMNKAGITDYEYFARQVLKGIKKPISFEVFSDNLESMEKQARLIASWGDNVYVKIPITNTQKESTHELIKKLSYDRIKVNVTAVFTTEQVERIVDSLFGTSAVVSVFAGRIADTGIDPIPLMKKIKKLLPSNVELLWASPREVLNIYQAEQCGCDIITCTPDLIKKYELLKGKDLTAFSLETVEMFYNDGLKAGFKL